MKVVMLFPGLIDALPPLTTAALSLSQHGAKVTVVAAGASEECQRYLTCRNVAVTTLGIGSYPQVGTARLVVQVRTVLAYLSKVKKTRPDVIWYHGGHAMRYAWLRSAEIVVAHAHEMYSERTFLAWAQRSVTRMASVCIAPEENRAWMLRLASHSKARWFVIPNRLNEDSEFGVADPNYARELFLRHGGDPRCTRFVIYQGIFMESRCLKEIVAAFGMLRCENTGLILLGASDGDRYSQELRILAKSDPRIAVIPRIPPPSHLRVTCGCAVGLLLYAPSNINNVYCAPNKIFEYADFGIPMVLPDYPGLARLNSAYAIGEFCNPLDPQSILLSLEKSLARSKSDAAASARSFLDGCARPIDEYRKVYECLGQLLTERHRLRPGSGDSVMVDL
jgi:glycosyltransferase involved in cell wall biosynthesis